MWLSWCTIGGKQYIIQMLQIRNRRLKKFDGTNEKLGDKVENFNATYDWESSEESHGASNEA